MRNTLCFSVLFFFLLGLPSLIAQSKSALELEKKVTFYNNTSNFISSIKTIDEYIASSNSNIDIYYGYLLKSYTYKRIFDYDEVFKCLDLAYKYGILSEKKEIVIANIQAEKAFALFDILKYTEAQAIMNKIKATNYNYLSQTQKSYLIMQDGYLKYKAKKFDQAEKLFDTSINIMKENNPIDLPMVFGKKVELYSEMNLLNKRQEAFNEGLYYAEKYKIIKYQLYMYEMSKNSFTKEKNYKQAYFDFVRYDSLNTIYNANENTEKINSFQKDLELKQKEFQLKQSKWITYSLIALSIMMGIFTFLLIKLNHAKKIKSKLLENEYQRIHDELSILTQKITSKTDLSSYNFSERQKEIINLLKEGKSNKQIAEKLFISENTVKYHLKTIYDILGIENRTQLFKVFNT